MTQGQKLSDYCRMSGQVKAFELGGGGGGISSVSIGIPAEELSEQYIVPSLTSLDACMEQRLDFISRRRDAD